MFSSTPLNFFLNSVPSDSIKLTTARESVPSDLINQTKSINQINLLSSVNRWIPFHNSIRNAFSTKLLFIILSFIAIIIYINYLNDFRWIEVDNMKCTSFRSRIDQLSMSKAPSQSSATWIPFKNYFKRFKPEQESLHRCHWMQQRVSQYKSGKEPIWQLEIGSCF